MFRETWSCPVVLFGAFFSKTRELSEWDRARIIFLNCQGRGKFSQCAVEITFKLCSEIGSFENRPKTERIRKTTPRRDRILATMFLKIRERGSPEVERELIVKIYSQTIEDV